MAHEPTQAAGSGAPSHQPTRVLVTGGAGFIGSNLVRRWLAQRPELVIINVDLLTYAADKGHVSDLPADRHTLVEADICDGTRMLALLREHDIDTVVHLAAESHVDRSIDGPGAFIQTNVLGTYALLEAARTAWLIDDNSPLKRGRSVRFHHVSTDEVYGDLSLTDPAFTERTPYSPSSPYSASKASSDHLVRAWARTYGLPVTISNCSNNYGPRQHGEKLIPTVIRKCLQREPIPVYGTGENIRDWLYVDDHCDAVWHIVTYGGKGETYNVGGLNEWTNLALVQHLCAAVAREIAGDGHADGDVEAATAEFTGLITFVTDRPGHDRRYAIDPEKLSQLGWSPDRSLDDGLSATVRWYLQRWQQGALGEHSRIGLGQ